MGGWVGGRLADPVAWPVVWLLPAVPLFQPPLLFCGVTPAVVTPVALFGLQLVQHEAVGDFTAPPEQQEARRDSRGSDGSRRGGQYDADAGSSAPQAEQYHLGAGTGRTSSARASSGPGPERTASSGSSTANVQSPQQEGAAGRLWEGTSKGAAHSDDEAASEQARQQEQQAQDMQANSTGFYHQSVQQRPGGKAGEQAAGDGQGGLKDAAERSHLSPGRQVGEIMRQKVQEEGWQLIVQGHSLGAGAAALVSLKLRAEYPGLKCIAYSCPGGLVSKNLAHALSKFVTTGKWGVLQC